MAACRVEHLCTSEVAALCLALAGEHLAGQTLTAYLDVFTHHFLRARIRVPVAWEGARQRRLLEVSLLLPSVASRRASVV